MKAEMKLGLRKKTFGKSYFQSMISLHAKLALNKRMRVSDDEQSIHKLWPYLSLPCNTKLKGVSCV